MSNFKCNVNAATFARVALAQSNEATRYYLNGVHIEPRTDGPGALMVATNGHILLVGYDAEAEVSGSAIVALPAPLLKAAGAKSKRHGVRERLSVANGCASVAARDCGEVLIDGSFPDWRRVVPHGVLSEGGLGDCGLNADYLAKLAAALNPDSRERHVRLFPMADRDGKPDGNSPHLVRGPCADMFGVLMPVRWKFGSANVDWFADRFAAGAA